MTEQRSLYRISGVQTLGDIQRQLNFVLQRIADRFDQMEGLRGTPTFYTDYVNYPSGGLTRGQVLRATSETAAEMGDAIDYASLTASRLLATDADKNLVSAVISDWISGNGITVTDNGDGTATLSVALPEIVTHVADYEMSVSDLGKIHVFSAAGLLNCTLPSVGAGDVGKWTLIVKGGAGNLRVKAADADTIMDGTAGGAITCTDSTYDYPKIGLRLLTSTGWHSGPESFGVWSAT